MEQYLGHSANSFGREEPLAEHLREVARYAALFGEQLGIKDESVFTALVHDIGKMGIFQGRLKGTAKHVDHWSFGAYLAKKFWGNEGFAATMAILGHHAGLGNFGDGKNINPNASCEALDPNLNLSLPASAEESDRFLKSLNIDPRTIPKPAASVCAQNRRIKRAAQMADIRMLYSILVDADFLATEGHFLGTPEQPYYVRPKAPPLLPDEMFERLRQFMTSVKKNAVASANTISIRDDLMRYALAATEGEIGNYTLTAPTGSGKTLAMLAFALKHAAKWNLKRIIVVIPFLSIIEQTAGIYRDALLGDTKRDCAPFVLEDHSRARIFSLSNAEENEKENLQNLTAENWDAPVIITTNIQFFESLFSNRPGACRKLHRMANSVILFDEVQTMKQELAVPTLATLGELCGRFNSTLVMATATQPAFGVLSDEVKKYGNAWTPKEIVGWNDPNPKESLRGLFDRARRTKVTVLDDKKPVSWKEIARQMVEKKRALCIVNLKKHAQILIDELTALLPREEGKTPVGLYHLSTSMCPAHRKVALDTIREELKAPDTGQFTLLVATQCIEAGVDIDFPVLFRAFGPLDSIAQAMGRCNRNQLLEFGEVFLFMPETEMMSEGKSNERLYPGDAYGRAAGTAISLITKMMKKNKLDLENPCLYRDFFAELYEVGGQTNQRAEENKPSVLRGIKGGDFLEVAQEYRLIKEDTINILVPYDREKFNELVAEAKKMGISGEWMARARDLTVTYYRSSKVKLDGSLENLPLRDRTGKASEEVSDDWFSLLDPRNENDPRYDLLKGFCGETDDIPII